MITKNHAVNEEFARRTRQGQVCLSLRALQDRYEALGYTFDRSMDCIGTATYVSGPFGGHSYPHRSLYPVQADNGLSAWNLNARRDENFQAMQRLRNEVFAILDQRIYEV